MQLNLLHGVFASDHQQSLSTTVCTEYGFIQGDEKSLAM